MRRDMMARLALGCAGIMMCGSLAGMGLANYVATGAFDFYRQTPVAEWRPEREPDRYDLAADALVAGYAAEPRDSYLAVYRDDTDGVSVASAGAFYEP